MKKQIKDSAAKVEKTENKMMFDEEQFFLDTVSDLIARCNSPRPYDLVRASGLLRSLLRDRPPLFEQANRKYQLAITFSVGKPAPSGNGFTLYGLSGGSAVGVKEFLAHRFFASEGVSFSVEDVITVTAHYRGGVHAGASFDFLSSDIEDRLLAKLQGQVDPVSKFLNGRFTSGTMGMLSTLGNQSSMTTGLRRAVAEELNGLISGPLMSTIQGFPLVQLSKRTKALLATAPNGGLALRCLNRLFLEDAYKKEIGRKIAQNVSPDRFRRELHLLELIHAGIECGTRLGGPYNLPLVNILEVARVTLDGLKPLILAIHQRRAAAGVQSAVSLQTAVA